ncbi:hypothetical protein CEE37_08115 [candidate division LCP-89 bacterium B3_LCP]|uniref:Flagellar protein FlgJ N-terminal domain-containing protein n=1 Tax=candidate division LCP-89 bacterium B3_LCP TaxID=2012998 RepID=A0A532UZF4_UNCL8|nr:MAG: hypothetical protein CEE37_08115 [candidate division LCP-89 bacterium B3_LCP]
MPNSIDIDTVDVIGDIKASDSTATSPKAPKGNQELEEACKKFEEIFLRQLLKESHLERSLGGEGNGTSKMYGDITIEAMARSLSQAGGLGLAEVLFGQLTEDQNPPNSSGFPNLNESREDGNHQTEETDNTPK